MTPSVASLWPEMPFVAECTTRSMPWRIGCWPIGVANVESSIVNGPLTAPRSSRSTRSRRGFDGLSAITSIVRPGRTAAANAPGVGAVDDGVLDAEPGARPLHEGHRAGVDLALDHDVVAGRAQRQHGARRWRPCRSRRPARPRRPRARRWRPRRPARSGWRSGCRSRRDACRWPACGCRRGRRSARCSSPTAGALRLLPWWRRPAVTARVAVAGGSGAGGLVAHEERKGSCLGPSVRSAGLRSAGARTALPIVRGHGHHRRQRHRHGRSVGHRSGGGATARAARGQGGHRRPAGGQGRRSSPTSSAGRSPRSTSRRPTTSSTPSRWPSRSGRCGCSSTRPASGGRSARSARTGRTTRRPTSTPSSGSIAINLDRQLRLHPHRRHGDEHRPSRWSRASGAPSSTSRRSPPSTARSARPATRRRRAASSA